MIVGIGLGGKSGSMLEGPRSEGLHVARMRLFRFTGSAYVMGDAHSEVASYRTGSSLRGAKRPNPA